MNVPAFSVIVPIYNEAPILRETVPRLLEGLDGAEVVFVCNGCTDGSRQVLAEIVGSRAQIVNRSQASKALALRAGEEVVKTFPRFYVDADVRITGRDLVRLAQEMARGGWELVSPRIVIDTCGSTRSARWVSRVWADLPHMRAEAFHCVLGISRGGRGRWNLFPDLLADDAFILSQIPRDRRQVISEVRAKICPPRTFLSWVRVRRRFLLGHRQLRRLGIKPPATAGQRRALLRMIASRRIAAVLLYLVARGMATALQVMGTAHWYQDRSSRTVARPGKG